MPITYVTRTRLSLLASNLYQALSETKNPTRTLKIAAPIAIGSVGILYMLCNIAYFAAVPKGQMLESGQIVAAVFFGNMFGARAEKVMSVFVALSAFGNVLSVIFSQGRSMLLCPSQNQNRPLTQPPSCPRTRPRRCSPPLKALGQQQAL